IEVLAIPRHPRRQETRPAGPLGVKLPLDRPIMRQIKLSPAVVPKLRSLRPGHIPRRKEPTLIEKSLMNIPRRCKRPVIHRSRLRASADECAGDAKQDNRGPTMNAHWRLLI